MPRVTVQPPTWWPYAQTVRVDIQKNGDVFYEGASIGRVEKRTRTWSPPLYPGSRIVRFHKEVPAWFGRIPGRGTWFDRDTRADVIRELLAAANVAGYGNRS